MYNTKDIQFVGKHDYDKEGAMTQEGWNKTFSIGVFQWQLKSNGKSMKKGTAIIRVSGLVADKEKVFLAAEKIVSQLDSNTYKGAKNVSVK